MSEYVMLGVTSEGKAEFIMTSKTSEPLLKSAHRAAVSGNTGGYIAVTVVQVIASIPCPCQPTL